jgi:DNA repair exonuclease SbcCD ATPase subunit/DNA repair exonuclease SbcCD nuclease subunit
VSKWFLTADLQLQNFPEFASLNKAGYNTRLVGLLEGLTSLIREHSPEVVVIAGDIWNNKAALETDLLDLTHSYFQYWQEELVSEVILLLGNHDTAFLSASIHSLRQFEAYCTVLTEAVTYREVAFSPWRAQQLTIEDDITALAKEHASVLIGHWTVKGAATNSFLAEGGIDPYFPPLQAFKHVLLGDVHKSQTLGSNILYLGSPMQQNFGEEGESKSVYLLDTVTAEVEAVPTSFPKYKTVDSLAEAEDFRRKGYYVRLKAKSREDLAEGNAAGLRVEQDFIESVAAADSLRALITTLEEAVKAYAIANNREDLLERGLTFLKGALQERSLPPVKLHFKRLTAENFLSYPKLDWDLTARTGLVIVHGEVIADAAYDSNGAGKTALYEALYYALYGVTLRYGNKRDLTIREGEKRNSVSLEFDLLSPDGTSQALIISRPRPGAVKLSIDGSDVTSSDANLTQKRITALIGDAEFFLRLTLLALHYHPSFLRLTDTEKKRFIDEFSGLDCFEEAREAVYHEVNKISLEESRAEFEKTRLDERKTVLGRHFEEAKHELAVFEENERIAAQERLRVIEETRGRIAELTVPAPPILPILAPLPEAPVKPPPKDFSDLAKEIEVHEETLEQAREALAKQKEEQQTSLAEPRRKTAILANEITALRAALKADTCPTCKRPFEKAAADNLSIQAEIGRSDKELATRTKELHSSVARYAADNTEFAGEIRDLEVEVKKLRSALDAGKDEEVSYARRLREYERSLSVIRSKFESECTLVNKRYEAALANYGLAKQRLEDRIAAVEAVAPGDPAPLKARLAEREEDLAAVEKDSATLQARIASLSGEKCGLEFWLAGFGNRGCKSLLYTALIDRLNRELMHICIVLSGGALNLKLFPYAESASGEQTERITMQVTNYLGANTFDGDSLGERNRIDIAVSLALRRVLMEFSGYAASLLFIDEPWVGLDNAGKSSVYRLLEEEARGVLVLATDQDKSSKGFAEAKIWTVRKEDKMSALIIPGNV